jgi:hypothetical protein
MLVGVSSPYLHAITCSKCGAALDPGSGAQILVCSYCQTSHVFTPPPAGTAPTAQARKFPVVPLVIAAVALGVLSGAALALRGAASPSATYAPPLDENGSGDPNLVYAVEQKVDIWHVGRWYPGRIRTVSGARYFITYDGYSESWDEWVTAKRLRPQSEVKPAPLPAETAKPAGAAAGDPLATYSVGQNVDVHWGSRWWPGRILKKDGSRYRITYDGWAASWDEWVGAERLRKRESGP